MDLSHISSSALIADLPVIIGQAVGKADLPPLTEPDDRLFLRNIMEGLIEAFWEAYVGDCSTEVQKQLMEASEDEDGVKLWEWLSDYADFNGDEEAKDRAQRIMKDFEERLPGIIKAAYAVNKEHNTLNSTDQ